MSAPPFPNEYRCRQVADADLRPCSICFKPTSTVLLASNKADHFYVCPLHLKDKSFASPIIPDNYTQLLTDKTRLEGEVHQANNLADANRPYSWNKLMSNIGWNESQTGNPKDGAGDSLKDSETEKTEAKKKNTYEQYVAQANELKKKLADVNSAISAFQFKQFVLVKDVYRMRINNTLQAKNRVRKVQAPVQESLNIAFPSVPKSDIK